MELSLKDCVLNFTGGGNKKGRYWILGFEPGGCPDKQGLSDLDEIIKYINDYKRIVVEGTVYRDLACIIRAIDSTPIKKEDNKETITLDKNGKFFYTNLYPLNFKNEYDKLNLKFYKEIFKKFEQTSDRRKIYNSEWLSKRYEKQFKSYLNEPKIILILKKNFNKEYKVLLGLEDDWDTNPYKRIVHGNTTYYFYKKFHQIVLLKNGRIGCAKIKEVTKALFKR